jgi:hypothetical protein
MVGFLNRGRCMRNSGRGWFDGFVFSWYWHRSYWGPGEVRSSIQQRVFLWWDLGLVGRYRRWDTPTYSRDFLDCVHSVREFGGGRREREVGVEFRIDGSGDGGVDYTCSRRRSLLSFLVHLKKISRI